MTGSELFDLYRRALAVIFGTYAAIRLVSFAWRWQLAGRSAARPEAVLRRYLVVSFLRVRVRRFWWDAVQIVALAGVLAYLVWLHV